MRSYVVKRRLHFKHSRRRRMVSPPRPSRESITLSSTCAQKGHFTKPHLLTVLTGLVRPALLSHAPAHATCPTTVLPESGTAHRRDCTLRSQSAREQSRRRSPAPFLPQISS